MGIADNYVRFTLRIPEELRERLQIIAKNNNRSLNSEIINILESGSNTSGINEETFQEIITKYGFDKVISDANHSTTKEFIKKGEKRRKIADKAGIKNKESKSRYEVESAHRNRYKDIKQ